MRDSEVFRLSFKAADQGDPPPPHRIRHLLKHALRSLGLICVDMDGGPGQPPSPELLELLRHIHDPPAKPTLVQEVPDMIRVSTTTLESFRRVMHDEPYGNEAELVASITGQPFEERWQQRGGKAWHSVLADPRVDVFGVPAVTDAERETLLVYRPEEGNAQQATIRERLRNATVVPHGGFAFSENAVALARKLIGPGGVWEVKATRTWRVAGVDATVVAQADHWRGKDLQDNKATWSNPSLADYEPSLQWRAYLICHDADSFRYNRFAFRDPKGKEGFCGLREVLSAKFWRYPDMERDVVDWLGQFVEWARTKGLLGFLQRESSTPLLEGAA